MAALSARLQTILELIPQATLRLVDVGCDHGLLSRAFLEAHPESRALLIDRRPGPLAKAEALLSEQASSGRAEFRLADGLAAWCPTAGDTVVIAGMGGREILGILERLAEEERFVGQKDFPIRILVQAMRDMPFVREALRRNGARSGGQKLCRDRGWIYSVDLYEVLFSTLKAVTPASVVREEEDWLGTWLWKSIRSEISSPDSGSRFSPQETLAYLRRQQRIAEGEIKGLSSAEVAQREALLTVFAQSIEVLEG